MKTTTLHRAAGRAKPVIKVAGKFILLNALRFGPAGVAGWAVKSVSRRPVRMLLAFALEPLLSRLAARLSRRFANPPR